MKNIISIIIIAFAVTFVSCKKEDQLNNPNSKSNLVLLDKTVIIGGDECYQYLNVETGQIIYEKVETTSNAKEVCYDKKLEKVYIPGTGNTYICKNPGADCYIGLMIVDGVETEVLVLKPGTNSPK